MTLLYVVLAILYLAMAITVVAMWYYLGKPHPILARLLSPIFILFLIWTAFGFPTHFNLFPNFPVRDVWCDCGNYTEVWWVDPDYEGNISELYKDCCKPNTYTLEDPVYGNITLPLYNMFRGIN